jgi:hypothetical protein
MRILKNYQNIVSKFLVTCMGVHPKQCDDYNNICNTYCDRFAQSIKLWSQKTPLLGKHVQTNTRPTIQEWCFICGSRQDGC